MILSIFYLGFLLAAGSNASPCKLNSGNGTSSPTPGEKAAPQRDGHGSAALNSNQKLAPQSNAGLNLVLPSNNSANNAGPSTPALTPSGFGTSGTSGTSPISGPLTPASGSCPPGFLNTVFNTNAGQSPGFPSTTWDTLTKHGISDWSTFSLASLRSRLHVC